MQAFAAAVEARGGRFLECPVGGTIGPAREGQLLGLAGGTDAAFAAAEPVLRKLTRRLEHLGPVGTASAMKLAINLPLMVYWAALGEAVALALSRGVDPTLALDILSDSSGAIGAAKKRIPPIRDMLLNGQPGGVNFTLRNSIKDMKLMEALAAGTGRPSPVIAAARATAERAAEGGWGGYDGSLVGMFGQKREEK
jgi:3-hydroxyisobutyrate dehydrogenase